MLFFLFIHIFHSKSSSSLPLARSIHYRAIEYRQLDTIHIRFNTSIIDIACAAVEFTSKLQLARNARTSLSLRAEATSMSS